MPSPTRPVLKIVLQNGSMTENFYESIQYCSTSLYLLQYKNVWAAIFRKLLKQSINNFSSKNLKTVTEQPDGFHFGHSATKKLDETAPCKYVSFVDRAL
ncbi:hypothetical protein CEXT_565311 [Caerostris extrusa]|uniref:Uncharacterized protein n=1 Tax=Caerostris extrusa TaxID=172846 RepID=A0AAV4TKM7_CAEEX|nr:hypothetical protein CEXT_565311 [Caerostris extrusa]